ncbi:hypothetical protein [Streptacidiphilus anmyonensis]|uniref:hypothetical protein n=1 Tax=Streptacidiphilus anmyonensis TaxID=405782 RepID=UPI000AF89044|nr:hypothetical protein [Streptacidiphilus anmyonensis]
MNSLPPPGLPPLPAPDPRLRDIVLDYPDMHALVAGLVLPGDASMPVKSALETSRELIRHSYFRYEFATVAVTHSLFALEQVLAGCLAVGGSLQELTERAVDAGLLSAGCAAALDRARLLRDRLGQGGVTSAALHPAGAVDLVRAVFDAVHELLGPSSAAEATVASLWEEHRRVPFPPSFRGVEVEGVELILLDADVAGLVQRELDGGLDGEGVAVLWACLAALDKVVPLIDEEYCACYFARLAMLARLVTARYTPPAT